MNKNKSNKWVTGVITLLSKGYKLFHPIYNWFLGAHLANTAKSQVYPGDLPGFPDTPRWFPE